MSEAADFRIFALENPDRMVIDFESAEWQAGPPRSPGVGVIAGPVALGWLSDQTSISASMRVAGVLVGAAAVLFWVGMAKHPAAGKQH